MAERHGERTTRRHVEVASWATLALGILVMLVPFVTGASTGAFWNAILAGGLIAGLAAYDGWISHRAHEDEVVVPALVTGILGLWLVALVFLAPVDTGYFWANLVLGLLIAAAAAYNVRLSYHRRRDLGARHRRAA